MISLNIAILRIGYINLIMNEGEWLMKVIFLDIDGVLNSKGTSTLDDTYISRLKEIVKATDAKIVLSSSWKDVIYNPETYNDTDRKMLDTLMNMDGLPFAGYYQI